MNVELKTRFQSKHNRALHPEFHVLLWTAFIVSYTVSYGDSLLFIGNRPRVVVGSVEDGSVVAAR